MLDLPIAIKRLFERDGVRKNFRARFPNGELPDITNKDLTQESVRFVESICSRDFLKFGLTESSVIEFETMGVPNMYGLMIECFCEIDTSSLASFELSVIRPSSWGKNLVDAEDSDIGWPFFRVPLGLFRVESCPRNQEAMAARKVTAYSLSYSRLSRNFADLPQIAAWPEFIVDPAALYAQLDETELVETVVDISTPGNLIDREAPLFNRAGNKYILRTLHTQNSYKATKEIKNSDFVKVDIQYDAAAYEAEGLKIVKALEDAGYDFSYTAAGAPLYKSHEEALRDRYPELFAPCLYMEAMMGITAHGQLEWHAVGGPLWSQPIPNNKLIPTAGFKRNPAEGSHQYAFSGIPELSEIIEVWPSIAYCSGLGGIALFSYTANDYVVSVDTQYPPVTINFIKTYKMPQSSGSRVKISNTADAQHCIIQRLSDHRSYRVFRYAYVDAYNREKMLDGYLELNAMFGKVDRSGKLVGLRLSTENPVEIAPSDYSQFWWDEFDVEPIGSVIFNYTENEEQQTVAYNFGAGLSVYDMTDNAVINSLDNSTREKIEDLIQQNFVPHLLPIAFTPIDLDMKGLPYLEDGDYLAVTAADGTVAHSFNMRHELGGIQVLEANVTSVSGQIMDSEVQA